MNTPLLEDLLRHLYKLLEQEETPDTVDQEEDVVDNKPDQPKQEPAKALKPPKTVPAKKQPKPVRDPEPLNREQLKYILTHNKGRIMTIVYRKKDGSTRILNTRLGVVKNITGAGLKYNPEDYGYIILWDLK